MPYFQDHQGGLHYLSETDISNNGMSLLPDGYVSITDGEAYTINNPPPSNAELELAALIRRDVLLESANEATAGMADAYIAGLLDDADIATFKAYAAYKLLLNKIAMQSGYPQSIAWPVAPS